MSEKLKFDKGMQLWNYLSKLFRDLSGCIGAQSSLQNKCCRLVSGSLIINSNANQQDCLPLRVYTHHVIVGLYARLRSLENFEKYLIITFTVQSIHEHGGKKMWKSGSSFQGNVTIWWEILYFSIKKYIRNSGKCNYLPGKNTFFPDLFMRLLAHCTLFVTDWLWMWNTMGCMCLEWQLPVHIVYTVAYGHAMCCLPNDTSL